MRTAEPLNKAAVANNLPRGADFLRNGVFSAFSLPS